VVIDLVLIGLVVGGYPIAITAFIVLLGAERGVRKGAGFVFGWLVSLAIVLVGTIAFTGNHPPRPSTAPSIAGLVVKLVVGLVLVLVAVRQQRRRGRPKEPKPPPKWQSHVDTMSPWLASGVAFLIQPWGLVAAGVATVMEMHVGDAGSYLLLGGYCLLASWAYLTMELYAGFRPEKATVMLDRLREWMRTHTDQVIIIASLVVGFWLIGKSAYLLVQS
jgi:hypothetical protein